MSKWLDFELECTDYLNKKFGEYATFEHLGGSDSTITDIKVSTKNGDIFYIDAKHSPAQSGQFVLFPNFEENKFKYSSKNITAINEFSQKIIDIMNKDFNSFSKASTAGNSLVFEGCENIFSNWIINTYKNKNVRYIITNNFILLPIDQLNDYFDITAKYRVKKSGSSSVSKKNFESVETFIKDNYPIDDIIFKANKMYAISSAKLNKTTFKLDSTNYLFSKRDNAYEIKRLSNTHNANVIFSIKLNKAKIGISELDFISQLKN